MILKRGVWYAFLAVFLWATLGVGFKLAVSRVDSFLVAVYVGFLATLALFFYILFTGSVKRVWPEFKKHPLFYFIAGIIGLGLQQILYLKGYALLPASNVVILFYSYPLFMVLLCTLFFKERVSFKSLCCVLVGFVGVYVLIAKGTLLMIDVGFGTLVTVLAALSWALFSVLIKHKKFDIILGMFFFNLFGFLFLVAMIPFFGFSLHLNFTEFFGMIYLAVFPTAIAFVLWNKALHRIPISLCSNIALLTPLLSIILIFIFLKESLFISQLVGLLLIVGSVFVNVNITQK